MSFLKSQTDVREVEWGKSYLWDVRFDDPEIPAPFNEWFPAQEVDENVANLSSFEFQAGYTSYKVPAQSAPRNVRLTFLDDANHSLFNWLDLWINRDILNYKRFVTPLADAVKNLEVVKLNNNREVIRRRSYLVYPEDNLTFRGNSTGDPLLYSVNFYVAGVVGEERLADNSSRSPRVEITGSGLQVTQSSNNGDSEFF